MTRWNCSQTIDFGEIVLWIGVLVLCSSGFSDTRLLLLGCISPVFVSALLINLSGIPMLEKAAQDKWGGDAAYKAYVSSTPVLIPFFGRAKHAAF